MLDIALNFLKDELNGYFARRAGADVDRVKVTAIVDENGRLAIEEGTLGISLIQVEEERILRGQLPEYTVQNGKHMRAEPDLRLVLAVMISANFRVYDQGLKYLSHVLACFQSQPVYKSATHPGLDPALAQISMELQSPSFEQLNQIWAYLGAKFLPSVIYKLRLVILRDLPQETHVPVRSLDTEARPS